jgi:hypothetical protein
MKEFEIRLIHEERQLQTRINKLEAYTKGDNFKQLPEDIQKLMLKQLGSMADYGKALIDRMILFGINTTTLTDGQKAAGVNFNPSNLPLVDELKDKVAELLDLMDLLMIEMDAAGRSKKGRYYSKAIFAIEDGR